MEPVQRLPPNHRFSFRQGRTINETAAAPTKPVVGRATPSHLAEQATRKRRADNDLRPIQEIKKLRVQTDKLKKDKDRLRKQVARSTKTIHKLKDSLAESRAELKVQKAESVASTARLTREKANAERRAKNAETRVEVQQVEIDALRAKIRALVIADARYKADEARRVEEEVAQFTNVCLKDRGMWSQDARRAVRKLYNIGCSIQGISEAFITVCNATGMKLKDVPSVESIRRFIAEGGVLAELHVVDELLNTDGECINATISLICLLSQNEAFTLVGDGTSHEKINYETSSTFLLARTHSANESNARDRMRLFLGVRPTESHASEVQFSTLDAIFENMVALYNDAFSAEVTTDDIYWRLTGTMGDHANDVGKTSRLWKDRKLEACTSKLVRDRWANLSDDERVAINEAELNDAIQQAGGFILWDALSSDRQDLIWATSESKTRKKLADEQLSMLPRLQQVVMDLFIRTGCGSHKLMNLFKHGAVAMHGSWPDGEGPILLFNKDNQVVMDDVDGEDDPGYGDAQRRAVATAQGGGIKVTSIGGLVFNHTDSKKGYREMHRTWMKDRLGTSSPIHTATSRFGSNGEAASEFVVHRDIYLEFLEILRDAKDSMSWTNIEQNVYKGLQDQGTFTELCAMSIFMESFFHPAFKMLRSAEAGLRGNALEQGQFYECAEEYLGSVVVNPDIVLSDTVAREATFFGQPWNRLDAVIAVRKAAPKLPHLRRCVSKMFEGARDACSSFLSEFAVGDAIDMATADQRELAFRPPTNDCSEGDLGCFRLFARQRQTKNTLLYNANRQYHENKTAAWEDRIKIPATFYNVVLKEARRRIDSRESEIALERIAAATETRALAHRAEREQRVQKEQQEEARLDKISQQTDLAWPLKGVTKDQIKDQLKVYRRLLGNPDFLTNISGNKPTVTKQYMQAVECWNKKQMVQDSGQAHATPDSNNST